LSPTAVKARNIPDVKQWVCCYCGACVAVCPTLALELAEKQLLVHHELCNKCGNCLITCPVGALID
jgi:L-aspartate semialdehyde sulfurtransferase ferredoxin